MILNLSNYWELDHGIGIGLCLILTDGAEQLMNLRIVNKKIFTG